MKKTNSAKIIQEGRIETVLSEQGYRDICGVDEVGRGPLAGPVVAAAVILPQDIVIEGIDDSKKLSPSRREELFDEIVNSGAVCSIGIIDNECIDKMNILKASLMAMRKAVMDIRRAPEVALVDGSCAIPNIGIPQHAVIGGDGLCQSIAAASIIAKITRDRIMDHYELLYPSFSFGKHRGYPTAEHIQELRQNGPCEIHRRSFKPVAEALQQYVLS